MVDVSALRVRVSNLPLHLEIQGHRSQRLSKRRVEGQRNRRGGGYQALVIF